MSCPSYNSVETICRHEASVPQLMFPSVIAVNNKTGEKVVGVEAFSPDVRQTSTVRHPIHPAGHMGQVQCAVRLTDGEFFTFALLLSSVKLYIPET